ncbi:fad binding domain-containing protein [Rutstroemia sp. NJR-2017a BVV2]|nr:fad binding domain-containing protein [Rutstroemia sp. NJR-2017a BVV2]PQE18423.1 fad binding domain-containing protein [Rutstroemia sp. NJR-2017a BVV2]
MNGTTGLLIAQGLKKSGIAFEIYERSPSADSSQRARDWSMALHWGSNNFESCLPEEVLSKIGALQCDEHYQDLHGPMPDVPYVDGATGEVLMHIPSTGLRRASRRKMRNLFTTGLDIHWGVKVTSIDVAETSVTVTFENGTTATGTHLVGADGARSIVRTTLLGDKAALTPLPYTLVNFKVSYPAEQARYLKETPKFHPIMNFSTHHEHKSLCMLANLDIADKDRPETWVFQLFYSVYEDEPGQQAMLLGMTDAERIAWMKSRAHMWVDPYKSATEWIPEGTARFADATSQIPADVCMLWRDPVPWDNHKGRITLAGDAAHAMTPHRGQGLNNAIQDAANYVAVIRKINDGADCAAEITAYDAEVLERGKREIGISYVSTVSTHDVIKFKDGPLYKMGIKRPDAEVVAAAA